MGWSVPPPFRLTCLPAASLQLLSTTLTEAVAKLLDNNKSPSRKGKELDNRGSSFYIAQYVWAATPTRATFNIFTLKSFSLSAFLFSA